MSTDRPSPQDASRGTTQRRLLAAAAGLAVAALAACAFVLTYDVLRDLAVAGRVPRRWAWAYPVMTDVLVVVVILSLVVARHARWWSRLVRWALLAALLAGVAAVSVQHAVWGLTSLPEDRLRAGVAVAPHVMLITGVWLWLTMIRRLRSGTRRPKDEPAPAEPSEPTGPAEPAEPEREPVLTAPPLPLAPAPALAEVEHEPEPMEPEYVEPEPVEQAPAEPVPLPRDEPAPKALVPAEAGAKVTRPDIPLPDDDTELTPVDRAEDPDAGDEPDRSIRDFDPITDTDPHGSAVRPDDLPIWGWNPPSGSFRSSPTAPGEAERGR